jgi:hypothetical protein
LLFLKTARSNTHLFYKYTHTHSRSLPLTPAAALLLSALPPLTPNPPATLPPAAIRLFRAHHARSRAEQPAALDAECLTVAARIVSWVVGSSAFVGGPVVDVAVAALPHLVEMIQPGRLGYIVFFFFFFRVFFVFFVIVQTSHRKSHGFEPNLAAAPHTHAK